MTPLPRGELDLRLVALTRTGKETELTVSILGEAGVDCIRADDLESICARLDEGAGAVLLAEEAIVPGRKPCLEEWLQRQSPWSDLPLLVLARPGADSAGVARSMDLLGNVTVLERPIRIAALVSAVRSALRARQRQYQLRDQVHALQESEKLFRTLALALQAKEAELKLVAEATPVGVARCSRDLRFLFLNRAAAELFRRQPGEMIGHPILEVVGEETFHRIEPYIDRVLRGERTEFEERMGFLPGGPHWMRVIYDPERDVRGEVVGWFAAMVDVTEQRAADRRKDEFLAILAHELRNPLAPIRSSLHLLRLTAQRDPALRSVAEMMDRQVNHMVRLVDDLMEVSRITRNKIELRREPVEVAAIVRGAIEISRPLIDQAGHRLALAVPPEPLVLEADLVRLTQALANLLNNAAKYTETAGTIGLTVRREGSSVAIAVRDCGIGIPPAMLPRVFDLFTQVGRKTGRGQGGLGIGLTLVKSLVEMHGGSVEAFSEGDGRGSEFVVHLPLARTDRTSSHPSAETAETAALVEGVSGVESAEELAARRILVVDDNHDAADSLARLLRLIGAEVQVEYSGAAALEALAGRKPAAVVLDIGMPEMDGYEVARRIRRRSDLSDVVLIALTGWGQDEDRRRSRLAGFDHHLVKPADLDALRGLLTSPAAVPAASGW